MPSTSRGYPYPSGSDDVDIPGDIQALADAVNTDVGTVVTNAATAQATANAAVPKATYDAHTVLAATTDNTPAAVTVAEQSIVGRKTGGNITALTAAEVKTLLGVTTGDVSGLGTAAVVDVPAAGNATSGQAVKGSDTRLTDARTPTAHKTSHQSGGSDEVTLAQSQVTDLTSDLGLKAPLASPTLTGVPTAPTAAVDTNTTQVATTAFTVAQIADDAVAKTAVGNLLTANQASVETDTTGFNDPFQCTLARTTAAALAGSASLLVTSTSTSLVFFTPLGTSGVPVTAGQTYTASGSVKAVGNSGSARVSIRWHDAAGSSLGDVNVSYTTVTSAGWTRLLNTAVAPAGAAFGTIFVGVGSIANADAFYVDCLGFWEGAGGQWALPGTPITNQGFYTDESCGRRLFQWDANNARWQQTYSDTGWRDVSADLINSYTGTVYLRRIGNVIHFVGNITRATSNAALNIPTGFKPMQDSTWYPSFATRSSTTGALAALTVDAQLYLYGVDSNAYPVSGSYIAGDAWPTTLPGTASGSIPA